MRRLLLELVALVLLPASPPPPRAPLADVGAEEEAGFAGRETRFRRLLGETDVERDEDEDDDDDERDDPLELLPLELLPLELLPLLLAALLERELLVDSVLLFFVRSRLRSFLASDGRTRLGLAAMMAVP